MRVMGVDLVFFGERAGRSLVSGYEAFKAFKSKSAYFSLFLSLLAS